MAKATKKELDENLDATLNETEDTLDLEEPKAEFNLDKPDADGVVDISMPAIKRKRFRINGEEIVELNTADMNILKRLEEATPKLDALQEKVEVIGKSPDVADVAKALSEIDSEMRTLVDFVFNADLADKCADGGNMYDMLYGKFRYEHIIDTFMALYEANLNIEYKLFKKRLNKYAKKR